MYLGLKYLQASILAHRERVRQPRPRGATASSVTTCSAVTLGSDKLLVLPSPSL